MLPITRSLTQPVSSQQGQHGADDLLVTLQIRRMRAFNLFRQLRIE